MADLVNISVPNAFAAAVLGYGVVFLGLVLLMFVLQIMGKIIDGMEDFMVRSGVKDIRELIGCVS